MNNASSNTVPFREQVAESLKLSASILSDPNRRDEILKALEAMEATPSNDYVAYLEKYLLEILAMNRSLVLKSKNLESQVNTTVARSRRLDSDYVPYHEDER